MDGRSSHDTSEPADPESDGGIATVDYAKSFHLRFAGNSTVRKKRRPKLRSKREDDGEDTSTDEEYDFDEDGADQQRGGENGENSQEMGMKLSLRECNTHQNQCFGISTKKKCTSGGDEKA